MKKILFILFFFVSAGLLAQNYTLKTKETLTVLEMNKGETLEFELANGRKVNFELLDFETQIVFTNLDEPKKGQKGKGTVYSMSCTVRIDGQILPMRRYVPVQESFYEPYLVNGLRIWFDALRELDQFFNENHGKCLPAKDVRFAFQDATLPICPQPPGNWCPLPENRPDVSRAYRADDTWLGTYYGADLHGGLDINMPSNSPLWAPIDFDEHYFFNSLKAGHNNNRWRGIRRWQNGDEWHLQTHHVVQLLLPEYQPVKKGEIYAYAAGVYSGYMPHTHFVFKVWQPQTGLLYIDPWVLFWQIVENNREAMRKIKARIAPVAPAQTGEKLRFSSKGSRAGATGRNLSYFWDFGDGTSSVLPNPAHIFQKPGMYCVRLTVSDGSQQASFAQHISINGKSQNLPSFRVQAPGEPSFRRKAIWKTRAYGENHNIAQTLVFDCFHKKNWQDSLSEKRIVVHLQDLEWSQKIKYPPRIQTIYKHGKDWLLVRQKNYTDSIELFVRPDVMRVLRVYGLYEAYILFNHNFAINSPQRVRVLLNFGLLRPQSLAIVDNSDADCLKSSYFWLAPKFHYQWAKGWKGDFLLNATNQPGEFVRYTPVLEAGKYRVSLKSPAYENADLLAKTGYFFVNVNSADGLERLRVEPKKSLEIGVFEFPEGKESYVEILSDGSKGLIIADAVKFERISP